MCCQIDLSQNDTLLNHDETGIPTYFTLQYTIIFILFSTYTQKQQENRIKSPFKPKYVSQRYENVTTKHYIRSVLDIRYIHSERI